MSFIDLGDELSNLKRSKISYISNMSDTYHEAFHDFSHNTDPIGWLSHVWWVIDATSISDDVCSIAVSTVSFVCVFGHLQFKVN